VLVPLFVIGLIIFACCRYRDREEEVLEEENEEGMTEFYVMDDEKV
tara:strand:- start:688 stop:825 length:138 start_codon:yes stop_codon:yes gene_type:complete